MTQVLLFNKPFNVLSQFTDHSNTGQHDRETLSRYIRTPDVYVAGRLDRDSEGLLVLTDSGVLQHKLTDPAHAMTKLYWAQVEGNPTDAALQPMREGLQLRQHTTRPAKVSIEPEPDFELWPRSPPIRVRRHIPTCWLRITLSEGRNRQVRRMCAACGFPVLRLIRYRIGSWTLAGIAPGEVVNLTL